MTVPFHSDKHQYVGGNGPRLDATDKVTGAATYTQDIEVAGMLYARMKVSPHAHARIARVDTAPMTRGVVWLGTDGWIGSGVRCGDECACRPSFNASRSSAVSP